MTLGFSAVAVEQQGYGLLKHVEVSTSLRSYGGTDKLRGKHVEEASRAKGEICRGAKRVQRAKLPKLGGHTTVPPKSDLPRLAELGSTRKPAQWLKGWPGTRICLWTAWLGVKYAAAPFQQNFSNKSEAALHNSTGGVCEHE